MVLAYAALSGAGCGAPAATPAVDVDALGGAGAVLVVDDDRVQCPTAAFTTIAAAVAAAAPGDRIDVCPGLYAETVLVAARLTLSGRGPAPALRTGDPTTETVLQPPPGASGLTLGANDIVVEGFTIAGQGTAYPTGAVPLLTQPTASGYRIRSNFFMAAPVFTSVYLRLQSDGVRRSVVRNNRFGEAFVAVDDGLGPAPELANALFAGNQLSGGTIGVLLQQHARAVELRDNSFGFLERAIVLHGAEACLVSHNRFDHAFLFAVQLAGARAIDVEDNDIADSQPGSGIGVGEGSRWNRVAHNHLVRSGGVNIPGSMHGPAIGIYIDSRDNLLDHNRIEDSGEDGIGVGLGLAGFADASKDNLLVGNDCRRSGRDGIRINSMSSGNRMLANVAFDNTEFDARDDNRSANVWIATKCLTDAPAGTICR
jgi:parallel beta-helix repeat protein